MTSETSERTTWTSSAPLPDLFISLRGGKTNQHHVGPSAYKMHVGNADQHESEGTGTIQAPLHIVPRLWLYILLPYKINLIECVSAGTVFQV